MLLIAHRGLSSMAPENTLVAVKAAIELDVAAIEIDVRITADGVPVLYHDDDLRKVTKNPLVTIENSSYQDLASIDAGSWFSPDFMGEKITTLEQILQLPFGDKQLMLDVKSSVHAPDYIAASIAKVLKNSQRPPKYFFASTSPDLLSALKHELPEITQIGIVKNMDQFQAFIDLKMEHIALWYALITPEFISTTELKSYIERGFRFWVFAVDDLRQAEFLTHLGIEVIITNKPQTLRLGSGM